MYRFSHFSVASLTSLTVERLQTRPSALRLFYSIPLSAAANLFVNHLTRLYSHAGEGVAFCRHIRVARSIRSGLCSLSYTFPLSEMDRHLAPFETASLVTFANSQMSFLCAESGFLYAVSPLSNKKTLPDCCPTYKK